MKIRTGPKSRRDSRCVTSHRSFSRRSQQLLVTAHRRSILSRKAISHLTCTSGSPYNCKCASFLCISLGPSARNRNPVLLFHCALQNSRAATAGLALAVCAIGEKGLCAITEYIKKHPIYIKRIYKGTHVCISDYLPFFLARFCCNAPLF